ncbi:MAG TPA: hypothetical protein VF776_03095 [Sphingomicrobium sp.]
MAFHLHLIEPLRNYVPGAPQFRQSAGVPSVEPQLSLRWQLGVDGRPHARWTRD